jgi:hypothetical protein
LPAGDIRSPSTPKFKWNKIPPQIVKPTLDQKVLLVQEQVIYLQDVYKTPKAFSNTYRKHIIEVYFNEGPSLPYIHCSRGTYYGKLSKITATQAKVNGCKPSFQTKLSPSISIPPTYIYIAYYNSPLQGSTPITVHGS